MHLGRSIVLLATASALISACSTMSAGPRGETSPNRTGDVTASERPAAESPSSGAGLSPAELQGRWWTWAASSDSDSNPVADPDGHHCAKGQAADVWFLAGTFGGKATRSCTVPAAMPVAFPLVNLFSDADDCDAFMDTAQGSAVLDDRALEQERHQATAVSVSTVDGNPITESGGRYRGHACGLWVQLEPLAPGSHELRIRGLSGDFAVSVDYTLRVSSG